LKNSVDSGITVRAIDRATDILKCFTSKKPKLSLKQISTQVNLPKSTVHRILYSLKKGNLIERDDVHGNYHLSFEMVRLGTIVLEGFDLRKVALPIMKWLSETTEQTSNLYIIRNKQRLCIEQVPGTRYVRRYSYLGGLFPLYCGSGGKVLLAFMEEDKLEDYFRLVKLERITDKTIINKECLMENLRQIRKLGYATSIAEREPGSASMSAPIFDHMNKLAGSITVSGPDLMLTEDNINKFSPLLLKAAREISKKCGMKI